MKQARMASNEGHVQLDPEIRGGEDSPQIEDVPDIVDEEEGDEDMEDDDADYMENEGVEDSDWNSDDGPRVANVLLSGECKQKGDKKRKKSSHQKHVGKAKR